MRVIAWFRELRQNTIPSSAQRRIIVPTMNGWYSDGWKASPLGAASFVPLAIIALGFFAFHLLGQWTLGVFGRAVEWVGVGSLVVAYILFAPAVACSLYSLLFERSKLLALVGLAVSGVMLLTIRESLILADGLLSLPFLFLGIMAIVKLRNWRRMRSGAPRPAA
jgi:hypothetical protein